MGAWLGTNTGGGLEPLQNSPAGQVPVVASEVLASVPVAAVVGLGVGLDVGLEGVPDCLPDGDDEGAGLGVGLEGVPDGVPDGDDEGAGLGVGLGVGLDGVPDGVPDGDGEGAGPEAVPDGVGVPDGVQEPSATLLYPTSQMEQSADEVAPVHGVILPMLQSVHRTLVSASAYEPMGHFAQPFCVPHLEVQVSELNSELSSQLTPPPQAQHMELELKSSLS